MFIRLATVLPPRQLIFYGAKYFCPMRLSEADLFSAQSVGRSEVTKTLFRKSPTQCEQMLVLKVARKGWPT